MGRRCGWGGRRRRRARRAAAGGRGDPRPGVGVASPASDAAPRRPSARVWRLGWAPSRGRFLCGHPPVVWSAPAPPAERGEGDARPPTPGGTQWGGGGGRDGGSGGGRPRGHRPCAASGGSRASGAPAAAGAGGRSGGTVEGPPLRPGGMRLANDGELSLCAACFATCPIARRPCSAVRRCHLLWRLATLCLLVSPFFSRCAPPPGGRPPSLSAHVEAAVAVRACLARPPCVCYHAWSSRLPRGMPATARAGGRGRPWHPDSPGAVTGWSRVPWGRGVERGGCLVTPLRDAAVCGPHARAVRRRKPIPYPQSGP